jgi:hypothetical protein
MDSESTFSYAGSYRSRSSNEKAGAGVHVTAGRGKGSGKPTTPQVIALNKLRKYSSDPDIQYLNEGNAYNIDTLFENSEQLRFMDMQVLAHVLYYYNSISYDMKQISYTSMSDTIEKLLSKKHNINKNPDSQDNLTIIKIRLAATFYRYIRYINQRKAETST